MRWRLWPNSALSRRMENASRTLSRKEIAMSSERPLAGLRLLMFVGDDYEDLEVWYPKLRLAEAGAHVVVAGPVGEKVYRGKHGYPCRSDAAIELMEADDFQGVVIPGGFMPD